MYVFAKANKDTEMGSSHAKWVGEDFNHNPDQLILQNMFKKNYCNKNPRSVRQKKGNEIASSCFFSEEEKTKKSESKKIWEGVVHLLLLLIAGAAV